MLNKKTILPILFFVQIAIVKILAFFPEFVEAYYSNGLYVWISNFERMAFGWIPFSLGDVIYFIAIIFALRWLWKIRGTFKSEWKAHLLQVLGCLSVFYFLFHLLWATNYHRVPLYQKLRINKEYTDADLLRFTKLVIAKTNDIHNRIVKNDSMKVVFPYSQEETFKLNVAGYGNLSKSYPYFHYEHPSIKKSIISLQLTYMGFAGYLNPFTNESQVNYKMPMYGFAATASHEMAHQIGYASESEANFIGYLACINNDDLYMQYSGYALALRYCLGNWEVRDEKVMKALMATVNPGVLKNFKESEFFWDQYESFVEVGFKIFYDNFLKLNQQEDGLDSYNKFVDLLVNYYKLEKMD